VARGPPRALPRVECRVGRSHEIGREPGATAHRRPYVARHERDYEQEVLRPGSLVGHWPIVN
jgi:hypothetical protein